MVSRHVAHTLSSPRTRRTRSSKRRRRCRQPPRSIISAVASQMAIALAIPTRAPSRPAIHPLPCLLVSATLSITHVSSYSNTLLHRAQTRHMTFASRLCEIKSDDHQTRTRQRASAVQLIYLSVRVHSYLLYKSNLLNALNGCDKIIAITNLKRQFTNNRECYELFVIPPPSAARLVGTAFSLVYILTFDLTSYSYRT